MKSLWKFLSGLFLGLLSAGVLYLVCLPPRGEPVQLLPPPTEAGVTVQMDGSVAQPGIYYLAAGSRVQDGIEAAGGSVKEADTSALNLAARLKDGEKVVVPARGTPIPPTPPSTRTAAPGKASATPAVKSSAKININTASAALLESLPGIGPYLAQQIIDYRQAHGPFKRIEDVLSVPGIGPKTFEKIEALISV